MQTFHVISLDSVWSFISFCAYFFCSHHFEKHTFFILMDVQGHAFTIWHSYHQQNRCYLYICFCFSIYCPSFFKKSFCIITVLQCLRRDTCHVYLHKLTSLYVVLIVFQCVCFCCCFHSFWSWLPFWGVQNAGVFVVVFTHFDHDYRSEVCRMLVFLLLFSLILIMITVLRCAECWCFCCCFHSFWSWLPFWGVQNAGVFVVVFTHFDHDYRSEVCRMLGFFLLFSLMLIMITVLRCAECWCFCFVFVTVVFICHESLRPFCWVIYSHFFPVQMLQAAASIAPRSVYVCGNTTTTSGLTVSFVWDVSFFVCAFVFCLGLGIQDYFIIQSEKLKRGWTLTTSQYIITHTVYFKTQRTGIEMYGWGLVMLKCVLGLVWQFYWMIWSTCPVVQIQKLPGDSTHLLYVQII